METVCMIVRKGSWILRNLSGGDSRFAFAFFNYHHSSQRFDSEKNLKRCRCHKTWFLLFLPCDLLLAGDENDRSTFF